MNFRHNPTNFFKSITLSFFLLSVTKAYVNATCENTYGSQIISYFDVSQTACTSEVTASFYPHPASTMSGRYEITWYNEATGSSYQFRDYIDFDRNVDFEVSVTRDLSDYAGEDFYVTITIPGYVDIDGNDVYDRCKTERVEVVVESGATPTMFVTSWTCNSNEVNFDIGGSSTLQYNDGGSWQTVSGNSNIYRVNDAPPYAQYRAKVSNAVCQSDWEQISIGSNHFEIPTPTATLITPFCANNTPNGLTLSANVSPVPSNWDNWHFEWYDSDNSIYNDVDLGQPTLPYDENGYQLAIYAFKTDGDNLYDCYSDRAILVPSGSDLTSPGAIQGGDQTICYNTEPDELTCTAPQGGLDHQYQWQSSADNSHWMDITGATSNSYTPRDLTATTWYRRQVTACGSTLFSGSKK